MTLCVELKGFGQPVSLACRSEERIHRRAWAVAVHRRASASGAEASCGCRSLLRLWFLLRRRRTSERQDHREDGPDGRTDGRTRTTTERENEGAGTGAESVRPSSSSSQVHNGERRETSSVQSVNRIARNEKEWGNERWPLIGRIETLGHRRVT